MGGGYPSPLRVGEQHRQAISHHDGAGQPFLSRLSPVGHRAIARVKGKRHNVGTMNLRQKYRLRARRLAKNQAVGSNALGVITDMVA